MKKCLRVFVFSALASLAPAARADTVLVSNEGTVKQVLQYTVTNGVWTYVKVFASGTYDGAALNPVGVASDGKWVYVADQGTKRRILGFGTNGVYAGTVVSFPGTSVKPDALLCAANGSLYMSDAFGGTNAIFRFDRATGAGGVFIPRTGWNASEALAQPRGLALDADGFLYVADRGSAKVRRFNAATGAFASNFFSAWTPAGLLYDTVSNRLYVTSTSQVNSQYTYLYRVTPEGVGTQLHAVATGAYNPWLGLVRIDGELFYSSMFENKVKRVNSDGTQTTMVASGLASPTYMTAIPPRADETLLGHWRFNEPTNAPLLFSSIEIIGKHAIQAKGMLQAGASGVEAGAVWFNALSRGQIKDSKALIPATNDFSVFMWMGLTNAISSQRHLFSCNNAQTGRCELGVDFDAASYKKLFWWHNGGVTLVSASDVRDGKWHHVGVVRRSDAFELWVDGVLETQAVSSAAISQAEDWRVGAAASESLFYLSSGGFMDDLKIYGRALESNEVAAVFTAYTADPDALPLPVRPADPVADFTQAESALDCTVVANQPALGEEISSPSFVILPDGTYAASHGLNSNAQVKTLVYRSADDGATWAQSAEINSLVKASLFADNGALYLIGTQAETGNVRIHRSDDGGVTWTVGVTVSPTAAFRMAPGPVVVQGGRLWKAVEDTGGTGVWPANARVRVLSAPQGADLCQLASWTCSAPLTRGAWTAGRRFSAWLDGNLAVDREGALVDMMRVSVTLGGTPEVTAAVRVNGATAAPAFDPGLNFTMLPGASKPFNVRYDEVSQRYWALTSAVVPSDDPSDALLPDTLRHRLALYSSYSLRDWCYHTNVFYQADYTRYGFQEPSFAFDGDDLVVLAGAAYEDGLSGPRSALQPNLLVFRRLARFRDIPQDKPAARVLVADAGANRVVRYCPNSQGQWCEDGFFTRAASYAGRALTAPHGMTACGDTVYVSEAVAGGRILAFSLQGLFRGVVTQFPAENVPDAIACSPDGISLYVSDAFGTGGDKIFRVNRSTGAREVFVDTTGWGGTLIDPRGVACDGNGNLYVADFQAGSNDGVFRKFSPGGTLLASSALFDKPRGAYWDETQNRLIGSVYGYCDLYQFTTSNLQTSQRIGDYAVATKYLGLGMIGSMLYFTDYDLGMIHPLKSSGTPPAIASGLNTPAHFVYLATGGEVTLYSFMGTCVLLR